MATRLVQHPALIPTTHDPAFRERRTLPALYDDPHSHRESRPRRLHLPETPQVDHSTQKYQLTQQDASQNKRRRMLHHPPLAGAGAAESAGYIGSGGEQDRWARSLASEHGIHQPTPLRMPAASVDQTSFLPVGSSKDDQPCCDSDCQGTRCAQRRAAVHDILAEVDVLHAGIQRVLQQNDSKPLSQSGSPRLGIDEALIFTLQVLRSNTASLRDLTTHSTHQTPERAEHQAVNAAAAAAAELRDVMKRKYEMPPNDDRHPFVQQPSSADRERSRIPNLPGREEEQRRSFHSGKDPSSPSHYSPTGPQPSGGSATFTHPSSPSQSFQSHRMLPSPTSLNMAPAPSTMPSLTSPSPSLNPQHSSAAQTAHFQDLQHQISLRTLALQTLRQEYDALLSKLDRQRTKCAALERKFEVTDIEINTLTADKEELEMKAAALEQQVEELREQRDRARRKEVETGEQYRTIVDMANRLQGVAAGEKRTWQREKEGLIRALKRRGDGGHVARGGEGTDSAGAPSAIGLGKEEEEEEDELCGRRTDAETASASSSSAQQQVIAALRVEVAQLRSRTQALETAMRTVRDEGRVMEEAQATAIEVGRRMSKAAAALTVAGGGDEKKQEHE